MRSLMVVVLLLAAASQAAAQTNERRGTVSGVAGGGQTWQEESYGGPGLMAGGRVSWALFEHVTIEGSVDALRHHRTTRFFEPEGLSTILSASLLHRFGSERAAFYLLEGLSLVRHTGTTRFENVTTKRRSTNWGYHVGVGFAVRAGGRLEIGPEARTYFISLANADGPALAYWIGGRVGFRF